MKRKIKAFLINARKKSIQEIEIEITENGSPYVYLQANLPEDYNEGSFSEIAIEEKYGINNNLYVDKDHIKCALRDYLEYQHVENVKNGISDEEYAKKREEEKEGLTFLFGNTDYTEIGFLWKGQQEVDMVFRKAVICGENFDGKFVDSNLTLEELKDLIEFRSFTASEIELKANNNFNFISW